MTNFQAAVIAAAIIKNGNTHYDYGHTLKEILDAMKAAG